MALELCISQALWWFLGRTKNHRPRCFTIYGRSRFMFMVFARKLFSRQFPQSLYLEWPWMSSFALWLPRRGSFPETRLQCNSYPGFYHVHNYRIIIFIFYLLTAHGSIENQRVSLAVALHGERKHWVQTPVLPRKTNKQTNKNQNILNLILSRSVQIIYYYYLFSWYWSLNSGLHAC
jgi:hypothetical protein